MPKLTPIAAMLAVTASIASMGAASAATGPARPGSHTAVVARVEGDTYVLLGPSVFGATVQQDPLAYSAVERAGADAYGHWRYDLWQAGQVTTYSGTVTCLSVSGSHAWVGGTITKSSDPTAVGTGAWWQVADNGAGRHPVTPDQTTFVGMGTLAETLAYCANQPAPHFIFDVQLGGVRVHDAASTG
jgi:hypothetical protein